MSVFNLQPEEIECLRLQGDAEKRWLSLRGIREEDMDRLLLERQVNRVDQHKRHQGFLREKRGELELYRRRIRRYERWLAEVTPGHFRYNAEQEQRWIHMKDNAQASWEAAKEESEWLGGIVDGLGSAKQPRPRVVRPRKRLPRPSPELRALIKRKVDLVYPNEPVPVSHTHAA
ncbi:hypothetical protein PM082_014231 [Marasmius tenuissimus]|nr:hypothetical protein PM082_014231 [Marasmius tenuissimus]